MPLPSSVRLFVTPWTAACQSSLSVPISQSLLTFLCIELVMLPNHLILCHPLLLLLLNAQSLQSCLTLCDPMDCSLPGSSVHRILQARILEWVAMPSSRESFLPRDRTHVSSTSYIAGEFFTTEPPGKPTPWWSLFVLPSTQNPMYNSQTQSSWLHTDLSGGMANTSFSCKPSFPLQTE